MGMKKKIKVLILKSLLVIFVLFATSCSCLGDSVQIKSPNVSGYFYPSNPAKLSSMIDDYIKKAESNDISNHIFGILSPHAGYIYSGPVAAWAYKTIIGKKYKTVVIIGPSHYQRLGKIAVFKSGFFQTPLGDLPIDDKFTSALIENSKNIVPLPAAFDKEHSLEVQIPFLQRTLEDFSIVPIIIGSNSYQLCEDLATALTQTIKNRNDVLVIASSDMSHYYPQNVAQRIDKKTLKSLMEDKPQKLFQQIVKGDGEFCGLGAVVSLMLTMQQLEVNNIKILKYATSAQTTNSDPERVVGYSSIIFYANETKLAKQRSTNMLSNEQKKELLKIAKKSITEVVKSGKRIEASSSDPLLNERRGAFVTIKKNGKLRGCIGLIVSDRPLINVVNDMAVASATADSRFPCPVQENELDKLQIEISVMSPIKLISDVDEIEVGTHGLIIKKGFSSGLLLPQVAREYQWTKEEFLKHTCLKAGLAPDDWKKDAEIYIFSAEVFSEEK